MVWKCCGALQMCLDYCQLNVVTRDVAYPIPHTQDCLDAVAGATLFLMMDIMAAYHQIPVTKEDVPKMAFITKYGLYEFKTMSFGLKTAPQTYQRLMELALSGLQWTACLIYLDDVIVYGKTFKEHLQRLSLVLQRFCQVGLKLKSSKCHFFKTQVTFFEHLLTPEGVLPDPGNVEKVTTWPVLTCATDVQAVLGFGNYYWRFIRDYSKKMQPLIKLTKKDQSFEWTDECQKSFDQLKEELIGPDIMAYPTDHGEFILDTDASLDTVGAIFSQLQDGVEHVIAYGSRTLSKPEQNYCVTDQEFLGVRFFMEYYKHYFLGRWFVAQMDHQALRWLYSLREPKDRIARWLETLSAYQFSIEYRPGHKQGNADVMSRRCPNPQECKCPLLEEEVLKCGPCWKCC